jgi:hypothetical protein
MKVVMIIKPPLQETDIPPYLFAKIGLDLSGPYPTSLSGNKYHCILQIYNLNVASLSGFEIYI